MKKPLPFILSCLFLGAIVSNLHAQTTYTLNPLSSFGGTPFRGDGSIQPVNGVGPSDSLGLNPVTGYEVRITAPGATNAWFLGEPAQDVRATGSTNGFNM